MVKIISISDEVYEDLSRLKNGKSFTELLKTLLTQATNKGDPQSILTFIEGREPISDETADTIQAATENSRRNATTRKTASFT